MSTNRIDNQELFAPRLWNRDFGSDPPRPGLDRIKPQCRQAVVPKDDSLQMLHPEADYRRASEPQKSCKL